MDADATAVREERIAPSLLRTVGVALSLAGVGCALTLVYLSMRSVMNVGGFCAEGGPYQIRQHCPQGVPGIMIGSIWGGIILALAYAAFASGIPSFASLLWSALFLSLGWNFFEYAFNPPGTTGGVIWGWLVCGVLFALIGGLPLVATAPGVVREFLRGDEPHPHFPGGVPIAHAQRAARRVGFAPTGGRLVTDLERLDSLRQSGALTQDEYETAKRKLLGET